VPFLSSSFPSHPTKPLPALCPALWLPTLLSFGPFHRQLKSSLLHLVCVHGEEAGIEQGGDKEI
jgi:hypothetical protein